MEQDVETKTAAIKHSTVETVGACGVGNPQPFHKMNITEMQNDAVLMAAEIEINWEQLNDDTYRAEFVEVLDKAEKLLPTLESMYTKLMSGKSVAFPDADTPLQYNDLEQYRRVIGEELYSGYVLREVYHKFRMVEAVMNSAYPLDNPEKT